MVSQKPNKPSSQIEQDVYYMQLAIELAEQGRYSTKPNPAVGCVLVKDGRIIGQGWHKKAGQPHAERMALADAKLLGNDAKIAGCTAYVTLEPCSHYGRTPPCADGLLEAQVARVVMAMQDPNPLVAGDGMQKLLKAGIEVEVGVLQQQAEQLNLGFAKRMSCKRPYVRLKTASSLDGRTALNNGQSKWITGALSRQQVHRLRAQSGALITGINTVLADDPSLTVRLDEKWLAENHLDEVSAQPLRVVLDSRLQIPSDANLLAQLGETLIFCTQTALQEKAEKVVQLTAAGISVIALAATGAKQIDLAGVLDYLAQEKQINDVMVEAGATLAGKFIEQNLVDELHSFIAPCLLGNQAKALFNLPEMHRMDEKIEFTMLSCQKLESDLYCVFQPKPLAKLDK